MAYLFLNCLSFTSCNGNEALPIYQLNHPQKINLQHATTQPTDRTTDNQPPQNVLSIHDVRTYKRSKHSDKKSQLKELSEYIETGILFVIPPVRPSLHPAIQSPVYFYKRVRWLLQIFYLDLSVVAL